jgi:hypothetical protein
MPITEARKTELIDKLTEEADKQEKIDDIDRDANIQIMALQDQIQAIRDKQIADKQALG